MQRRLAVLGGLVAVVALVVAGCSSGGDDDDSAANPNAETTAIATPSPTATPTSPPTSTPTTPPTSTAIADSGVEIEVGPIRMTNVRYEPPGGAIGPQDEIRITPDVESSFDGELRVFIGPLSPSEGLLRCQASDGNQAFERGSGSYDRAMRPVDIREGCPLPDEAVPITGFEVSVFALGQPALARAELPAEFVIDPALAPLVRIDGWRYRIVAEACQTLSTVGLVSENLLLQSVLPLNPDQLVSFQWVLDEGGVSGYVVQRAPGGELLEGEPSAALDSTRPGGVVTDETVLFSEADPGTAVPFIRAHMRPAGLACPRLEQQLDADAEPGFGGRWGYGVFQACPIEDGVELWLSDGGLLSVRGSAGTLEGGVPGVRRGGPGDRGGRRVFVLHDGRHRAGRFADDASRGWDDAATALRAARGRRALPVAARVVAHGDAVGAIALVSRVGPAIRRSVGVRSIRGGDILRPWRRV